MKRLMFVPAVVLLVAITAIPALADNPKVNVHTFRPSVHPGDLLGVQTTAMPEAWGWMAGAYFSFAYGPLKIVNEDGDNLFENVQYQLMADVVASIAFTEWLDLGVDIPVLGLSSGETPPSASGLNKVKSGGLGDLRVGLKGAFLRPDAEGGFGLALAEDVTFPTSTGHNLVGDEGFSFTTLLVADYYSRGWRGALNAGYRARTKKTDILPAALLPAGASSPSTYDEIVIGAAGQFPILCGILEGMLTIESRTKATSPFSSKEVSGLDVMAGVKYHIGSLALLAGGGAGLLKAIGSPKMLGTLAVSWEPKTSTGCCPDRDADGVCDDNDRCPDEAGSMSHGGCADSDNDSVYGPDDKCPTEAGQADMGGCPDTDRDGVPDSEDACKIVAGPAIYKGCPDSDGDGLSDHEDRCPTVAGPRDLEGCKDADRDGVIDVEDQCPAVPGVKALQGCPSQRIEITKEKIVLKDKVFFEFKKAILLPESNLLLDEVAKALMAHPEIARVRIEGHTDNVGNRKGNLKLSQERAESVRSYLIKAGVHPSRLEAQGFGDRKPLMTNKTEDGRATNRRVEFMILQRQ